MARRAQTSTIATLPSFEAAVAAYLGEARRRNLSAGTLETYRSFLLGTTVRALVDELGIRSAEDINAANLRTMERLLLERTKAGPEGEEVPAYSASTVHIIHRTWRTFGNFCAREGWFTAEQATKLRDLRGPKLPERDPATINEDQERTLLKACRSERDRFLLTFMLRTGLRLAEVCAVTLDDIIESPAGTLVRVRQGKGRKDRAVPLDTPGCNMTRRLRDYVRTVRPQTPFRELFIGRGGEPLRPHGVYALFRRLQQETGIEVHPHMCRHTFATRSLAAGVGELALQKALGHTTLAMTARYVHATHADLLDAWRLRRD